MRRVYVRAVLRGSVGTAPRGVGAAVDLHDGSDGRLTLAAGGGDLSCHGDRDGVCSGAPDGASKALFVTLGLEFPITSGSGLSIGADVDRWEALEGPFSSMFVGTLILRFYL